LYVAFVGKRGLLKKSYLFVFRLFIRNWRTERVGEKVYKKGYPNNWIAFLA
jgi:hypothetical protein